MTSPEDPAERFRREWDELQAKHGREDRELFQGIAICSAVLLLAVALLVAWAM